MKKPQYIFIHHTAVSYSKNPDQWRATDAYHKSKGWGGGGYNYEVAANGSIHQFREDGAVTTAQYQKNMNNGQALSICLDGNFDNELPTPEQKKAVAAWLQEKMALYGIPPENVFCHRKIATYKSCPGNKLPDEILYYFLPMNTLNVQPSDQHKEAWDWLTDPALGIVHAELNNPKEPPTKEWVAEVLHRMALKGMIALKPDVSSISK